MNQLQELFNRMAGRVKYRLGAKAKLTAKPEDITHIDCSGFVRYVIAQLSDPRLEIPDGSQNQLAWARKNLRMLAQYSDVEYAAQDPRRVFIAFLSPKPGKEWPRHVWLCQSNGKKMMTIESCSSLGVGSRRWDSRALIGCKECFELS